MSLLLNNARYIDWKTLEFKDCNILVHEGERGKIEFSGQVAEEENPTVIDCKGKFVTKSFACGHHHVYSALSRGMGAPSQIPTNFLEILQYIWWKLDKCLDKEMIEASALATAIYCAKNGVTFVIDHHSSPSAIEDSLEIIAAAFDKVGISHLLCYEMSGRDGLEAERKGLEETERYLKNGNQGLVGLHASFTVGTSLLQEAVSLAEKFNSGIHVHAAEDSLDEELCQKEYKTAVIKRFFKAGVLQFPKTILAHCLYIDPYERDILKESPVSIAENTESNLNNNVGFFSPVGLNPENIFLGTDGMHSDMIRSAKASFFVGQFNGGISPDGAYRRFRNVHEYIRKNKFQGDGENNLVILDYDSPTPIGPENFPGHFIYGLESRHVESVISNGRLIVHERKVLTVNEEECFEFSRNMGQKLFRCLREN